MTLSALAVRSTLTKLPARMVVGLAVAVAIALLCSLMPRQPNCIRVEHPTQSIATLTGALVVCGRGYERVSITFTGSDNIYRRAGVPLVEVPNKWWEWSTIRSGESDFWHEEAYGWPFRLLAFRIRGQEVEGAVGFGSWRVDTFSIDGRSLKMDKTGLVREHMVPFLPIWQGFLANTIVFTLLLLVPEFIIHLVVRRYRRMQQMCIDCGYPRKGLPTSKCPECGRG